jgi:transcriptional regulator with XRE-family HTH domain
VIDYIRSQIKKRRAEKGLTQSDIAVDMGITAGAYNKIETGPTAITIEKLAEISAILEVDISYFFKEKGISNKVEDPAAPFGYATKSEVEELAKAINKLKQEMAVLKASVQKPMPVKKKKKA